MVNYSLEWRDNTPVSTAFDDVYYCADDGLAESRYVFLANNNLPSAWQETEQQQLTVLETGFGTGLNFCATAMLWQQHAKPQQTLHFVSVEKYPLGREQINKALSHWPELVNICDALSKQLPPTINGWHNLYFKPWNIELTLIYDDINTALPQISANDIRANTFFLDGFAPAKNPDMWTEKTLCQLAQCAAQNATLATFTSVGQVRRNLQSAGFSMCKVKGFGRKREMLVGTYNKQEHPFKKAWHKPTIDQTPKTVAVVGAGIAGSIVAHKLASRGLSVNVYEKAQTAASAASGNSQGVLFIRLSAGSGTLSELSLASFIYAQRYYQQRLDDAQLNPTTTQFTGMLQLLSDDNWQQLHSRYANEPALVRFINAEQASHIAGTRVLQKAAYFPSSGWISPPALCEQLLNHSNITLHTNTSIDSIVSDASGCQLTSANTQYSADAIVLATAIDCQQLLPDLELRLKPAPGQITLFNAEAEHEQLHCVVCHEGYIAPPMNGQVAIGATFRVKQPTLDETEHDHQQNLQRYHAALPDLPVPTGFTARVSSRTTTGDYLPITGPVANTTNFAKTFAALGHNARQEIDENGCNTPNLYVLTGLGSRGLSYAPLAAELLCQQMLGEPIRISPTLAIALNPARFIVRALKRGKLNV